MAVRVSSYQSSSDRDGRTYYECRLVEFQAFLTELVGKFEFALTDKCERIRREGCLVMSPTLEGEVERGVQLPLRVSVAPGTDKEY
jgi:hypothetical protein